MWFFWQGGCIFYCCSLFVCFLIYRKRKHSNKQIKTFHFDLFLNKMLLKKWNDVPFIFFFSTVLRKHVTNLENTMKKFIVGGRQHSFKLRYAGLVSLFVCFPFSVSRLFFGYFRSVSNLFICLHCRIGSKMKNQLFPDLCLANSLSLSVPRGVQKLL